MGKKGDGMPIFNEEMYLYDKKQNSDLFHLHSFGRLYPDADYIISLKENSNTIIECVTDGVGYIEHNGTVTTVEKGDCYIIKQGSGYSYYSDEKNPYSKVWVTVYGSMVDRWLDFYGIDRQVYIKHLDITSYYSQIKQTALGRDMLDNEKKLMLLVHAIIFEMATAVPANRQSREDRPYIKTADNVVLDIKKYIEKQCNERLTNRDLSLKFGISQSTMNDLFIKKYGISTSQYHMQCKLSSAEYFLKSTDLTIDAISSLIGFCDRSHFRKAFMKAYGMSPNQYRKKLKSELSEK